MVRYFIIVNHFVRMYYKKGVHLLRGFVLSFFCDLSIYFHSFLNFYFQNIVTHNSFGLIRKGWGSKSIYCKRECKPGFVIFKELLCPWQLNINVYQNHLVKIVSKRWNWMCRRVKYLLWIHVMINLNSL